MNEPKQATSRQRSAFSDAVEILNELFDEGITAEEIIKAMDWSGSQMHRAGFFMNLAALRKMKEEETTTCYQ